LQTYQQILTKYWGYSKFRELQEDIIDATCTGKDVLGLLPTGGGKSITFQVSALHKEGLCLVITPLIALMKDQVENLKKRGIKALAVYSGMSNHEIQIAFDNCAYGNYKFLYLSPERLSTANFRARLNQFNVNLIAVDEAHCISQWGYDFRPSYLRIAELRDLLPDIPVLALTATATPNVVDDIQEKLAFNQKLVFQKSFERKNIIYIVRYMEDKLKYLLKILSSVNGTAIIYVRNRKSSKDIALYLHENGISADYYHAGLKNKNRALKQERWKSGKIRVIVATNAFGMGIDKPDVRLVIHMDIPDSLEAYYQEAGRAGRDEKQSFAVLLYNSADETKLKTRMTKSFPARDKIKAVYQALCNYCSVAVGEGKGNVYDFKLFDFCKTFGLDYIEAHNSLKILQQEGYIETTDEVENPSRLLFIVQRDALYQFQVANARFDALIKLVLRSYTGVFNDYVKIDEDMLAARLKINRDLIYDILVSLSKNKIINYIPSKQTPFVIFATERLDIDSIIISKENYDTKKEIFQNKLNAVLHYATTAHHCRSKMMLEYFGQKDARRCGQCDYCSKRNELNLSQYEFDIILEKVKDQLSSGGMKMEALVDKIPYPQNKAIKVIRWLFDQKKVRYNNENLVEWSRSLFDS
jgi:ATP-dependent DNA helicase RecQ